MVRKVVMEDRVWWALNTFVSYKVPDPDGIHPICLQKGLDLIIKYLIKIYHFSYEKMESRYVNYRLL